MWVRLLNLRRFITFNMYFNPDVFWTLTQVHAACVDFRFISISTWHRRFPQHGDYESCMFSTSHFRSETITGNKFYNKFQHFWSNDMTVCVLLNGSSWNRWMNRSNGWLKFSMKNPVRARSELLLLSSKLPEGIVNPK